MRQGERCGAVGPARTGRREFFKAGAGAAALLLTAGTALAAGKDSARGKASVTPNEDLMREHGAFLRLLLVYDALADRLRAGQEPPSGVLLQALKASRDFNENYHARIEEQFIFPRFENAGEMAALVQILWAQHDVGRQITAKLLDIAGRAQLSGEDKSRAAKLLTDYRTMYLPHIGREDTVLFPAFRKALPAGEYNALADRFEDLENKQLGENGFEKNVAAIADMEKKLGIDNLADHTPVV